MKLLIGATCAAVIAFVGYFFWNEYADAQARARNAQAQGQQAFENGCWRITTTSQKYDKAYADSLSNDERIHRLKKCITYFETGKMP